MPSKKQYNLVHNDEYDTRIPLHSEEAFHRGIVFHAKFIGSMEVPRPTSRMEIVAAMRRIRYEFKAKGIKKKKVTLEVSVDGLKVTLRKKKFPILQKKQHWLDESKLVLMHHPIYRIFYVSHDSHDLKIFSYIARDGNGNSFRCNVFKSSKKSQAMRVVRTVGQAFEVCHKLSLNNPPGGGEEAHHAGEKERPAAEERHDDDYDDRDEFASLQPQPSPSSVHKDISLLGEPEDSILDQPCPQVTTTCPASPLRQSPLGNALSEQLMNGELTALKHEIQLLRERLDQQSQQTRAAVAHARLLQDQLAAETAARVEAQARTHQLLVQNKELLEHIAALVSHLREHERGGVSVSVGGAVPGGLGGQLGQVTGGQGPAVADIAALGQYNAWEVPSARYSPLDLLYGGAPAPSYADELRYQAQLWDNLRCGYASAPATPLSPYAPVAPRAHGPAFSLPPTGRPRPSQLQSPSSTLPRASRVRAGCLSPAAAGCPQHQPSFRSRSLERPSAELPAEPAFIKPLPCRCQREPAAVQPERKPPLRNNLHELMRPLVLDPPPRGRSRGVQTECDVKVAVTRPSGDSMPKIVESEDEEEEEEEEARPPQRRNSQ